MTQVNQLCSNQLKFDQFTLYSELGSGSKGGRNLDAGSHPYCWGTILINLFCYITKFGVLKFIKKLE